MPFSPVRAAADSYDETGGSVGFLRRHHADTPPNSVDREAAALDELHRAGVDTSTPHQTRHFIYVPGVKAAQQLANVLKGPQRQVEIDTSARKGYWLVVIRQSMLLSPQALTDLRAEVEAAAGPLGGEYDRWQVDREVG
jgi:Regulator of ribonuclease activity B